MMFGCEAWTFGMMDRQRNGERDGHTDNRRETDGYRSMEGLIDRETKKQMNKQINKEVDGKT
jgi:hypothetical protein